MSYARGGRSVAELKPEPDRRRGKDEQWHRRAAEPFYDRIEFRRRDRLAAVGAAHEAQRDAHALIGAEQNQKEGEEELPAERRSECLRKSFAVSVLQIGDLD